MRKLLTFLIAGILTCTVDRVAHFFHTYMGADWSQAWGFAIFIAAVVWACSYLTREHVTAKPAKKGAVKSRGVTLSDEVRKQARIWLFIAILADGVFNLSDVLLGLPAGTSPLLYVVGGLYGAMPTILSAGLGGLQGAVDRLPAGTKRPIPVVSDIISGADAWAKRWAAQMRKKPAKAAPAEVVSASSAPLFLCARCGWTSDPAFSDKRQQTQNAGHIGSHMKADKKAEAAKP